MDSRTQFTFYASYWESIKELPAKSRLPVLEAVIEYALFGMEPTSLPAVSRAVFLLVKPTLDSARKKAASGKQGGKTPKQTESKPQANGKQPEREKEKEKEKEKEVEIEGEKENDKRSTPQAPPPTPRRERIPSVPPPSGQTFTTFWQAYPNAIDRAEAWEAWKKLNPTPETVRQILTALEAWKRSTTWLDDGGRFIPKAANFLTKGYWQKPPKPTVPNGATGEFGEAEMAAMCRIVAELPPWEED